MDAPAFDLETYLNRIRFNGAADVSPDTLERLHHTHFQAIPFENFDVLLGRGIDLSPSALFNKMISNRRGGYCFELNGLFLQALLALGFKDRALLARVHVTGTPSGRGHQLELISPTETIIHPPVRTPFLHPPGLLPAPCPEARSH